MCLVFIRKSLRLVAAAMGLLLPLSFTGDSCLLDTLTDRLR